MAGLNLFIESTKFKTRNGGKQIFVFDRNFLPFSSSRQFCNREKKTSFLQKKYFLGMSNLTLPYMILTETETQVKPLHLSQT